MMGIEELAEQGWNERVEGYAEEGDGAGDQSAIIPQS